MIKDKYIHHYFISSFSPCNTSSPFQKNSILWWIQKCDSWTIWHFNIFLTKEINRCEIRTILRHSRCFFFRIIFVVYVLTLKCFCINVWSWFRVHPFSTYAKRGRVVHQNHCFSIQNSYKGEGREILIFLRTY